MTDAAGVMTGIASLDLLRAAVRKGAHLGFARLGDIAVKWDPADAATMLVPILDGRKRIVDVKVRPEATFLPVAEPDLSHLELRNLIDAYLSTWISSIGDYVRSFEHDFARRVEPRMGGASNERCRCIGPCRALHCERRSHRADFTFAICQHRHHVGARPVVDVDPDTWCLSIETIEKANAAHAAIRRCTCSVGPRP